MEIADKELLDAMMAADVAEGAAVNEFKQAAKQPMPDPDAWLEEEIKRNVLLTTVDAVVDWGRRSSVWPVNFGLACCAFEMIAGAMSRFDLSRFGMEILRPSPRQADLMWICGTLTWKMAPVLRRIYDQMAEPKWVLAMGVCAISGGTFRESYSVVPGANLIVPVDVYVPGCPPRPESLYYGLMMLHKKIGNESVAREFREKMEEVKKQYLLIPPRESKEG